jgi:hypothetical protein
MTLGIHHCSLVGDPWQQVFCMNIRQRINSMAIKEGSLRWLAAVHGQNSHIKREYRYLLGTQVSKASEGCFGWPGAQAGPEGSREGEAGQGPEQPPRVEVGGGDAAAPAVRLGALPGCPRSAGLHSWLHLQYGRALGRSESVLCAVPRS